MTLPRHSWGEPNRFVHKTERLCLHPGCNLVKVTRHEGEEHWVEWWRDGTRIRTERTPACVAVEARQANQSKISQNATGARP